MTEQHLRLAAYGICIRDDHLLLARYVRPDGSERYWTLPGGRVEHAEDPYDGVVREVEEETGYVVRPRRLLGVDSRNMHVDWGVPGGVLLQHVGVFYEVEITGGDLRHEMDGSTDLAAWVPMGDVPHSERAVVIDVGLELVRTRPDHGHVPPVPVPARGLLRY